MSKPLTFTPFRISECPICDQPFISCSLTRRKYCSENCMQKAKHYDPRTGRVREEFKTLKPAIIQRECLRCSQLFPSTGPGNRLCKPCTQLNRAISNTCIILGKREAL